MCSGGQMINLHAHEYMYTEWEKGRHETLEFFIRRR